MSGWDVDVARSARASAAGSPRCATPRPAAPSRCSSRDADSPADLEGRRASPATCCRRRRSGCAATSGRPCCATSSSCTASASAAARWSTPRCCCVDAARVAGARVDRHGPELGARARRALRDRGVDARRGDQPLRRCCRTAGSVGGDEHGCRPSYAATPAGASRSPTACAAAPASPAAHGAKNSVDRTSRARRLSVRGSRGRARRSGELAAAGRRLAPRRRRPTAPRATHRVGDPREVVLSAGVLGTTELLLASRDRWRTLPWASPALGRHVRTNSGPSPRCCRPTPPSTSPTAVLRLPPRRQHARRNNRFPASYGFMRWYLARRSSTRRRQEHDYARDAGRDGATRGPRSANALSTDWHRRVTVLTVMQHDDNELALELRRGPLGWGLRSRLALAPSRSRPTCRANAYARAGRRRQRRDGVRHAARPGAGDRATARTSSAAR